MMDDPLLGCRLKLQQAQCHLWDLQAELERFQESDRDPTPPLHLGVIVGDFLHNLRCGLDHLVWQLVLLNGATATKSNQFPICDTEDEFRKKARQQLRGLTAHQVDTVASLPYRLGRSSPWCDGGFRRVCWWLLGFWRVLRVRVVSTR